MAAKKKTKKKPTAKRKTKQKQKPATKTQKKKKKRPATKKKAARPPRDPFLVLTIATITALDDAVALLQVRATLATGDERREINAELPELEAAREKVTARFLAYVAGKHAVKPPTATDVDKVRALADELDGLIANGTAASTVIDAATKAVRLWRKTQG